MSSPNFNVSDNNLHITWLGCLGEAPPLPRNVNFVCAGKLFPFTHRNIHSFDLAINVAQEKLLIQAEHPYSAKI